MPHVSKLCAMKGGPPALKVGCSLTGADYKFLGEGNTITLENTREKNPYFQLWAFLFESCNALNKEEFKAAAESYDLNTPEGMRCYGNLQVPGRGQDLFR